MIQRFLLMTGGNVRFCSQGTLATGWLVAVVFCLVSSLLHAQTSASQLFSQGDPTLEEQYLLERLNRARMDPVGEGQRLAAWL